MNPYAVAGFLVAILPLIATPGASLALLTQRVVRYGARHGLPVILGTVTGLYVHAALATAGLSALVMRSSELFTAVRLAGAAYLIALGVWTWLARDQPDRRPARHRPARARPWRWTVRSAYGQAVVANVLNPKAAAIFLTLVPQFLDPRLPVGGQVLAFATAQALLVTAWLLGWTAVLGRARRALRSATFMTAVRRITSAALVGVGLRAALT